MYYKKWKCFLFVSLFSDQVKKSCKIRDEYFMVKDFAAAKENLPGIRRPVTGAYPSNQGWVLCQ